MTELRVVTYNIYLGGTGRGQPIYDVLSHTGADVIALTEADDPDLIAALAKRLNMHHIWARGSGDRHIATLSRFPVITWQLYNTPPLTQAALETTLDFPGSPLTLYSVHLLPYLLLPFEIRRRQAVSRLLQIISAKQSGPHLIVGDFNAIAPGDRVLQRKNPPRMRRIMTLQLGFIFRLAIPRLLNAGYTDCYRYLHPHADGFTWYPGNPTTRYDYIFASPLLVPKLKSCYVIDDIEAVKLASDHMPLVANFEV